MLENFIYRFNLVTTLTKKRGEINSNFKNNEIDFSNSTNFYHLVESFNKLYLLFKKDYENLSKLDLGENVELWEFYKDEKNNYKCLTIYIDNPKKEICDYEEIILLLYEEDGKVHSRVTNNLSYLDKNYFNKELNLDEKKVENYLSFGEKYQLFIDSYYKLKDCFVFGDGTTVLFTKINGRLLENLSTFKLTFGNAFFNSCDNVKISFNLGEKLDILYEKSELMFDLEKQEPEKEIIDKLVNDLYINNTKLPQMYLKEKQLVKEKK